MSKVRWFPTSWAARLYLLIVYGILLPWFVVCFVWGGILKGWPISPAQLQLQVQDLLNLLCLPPLAGMGVDLCIARWADVPYRSKIRRIGIAVLLIALGFTALEMIRFYVLKS